MAGYAINTPATDVTNVYFLDRARHVVALDVGSGARRWQQLTAPSGVTYGSSGCVVTGGSVVCGDDSLFGFDTATGALRWTRAGSFGEPIGQFALTAANGLVYAGTGFNTIYAIDGTTGAVVWAVHPLPSETAQVSFYDPSTDGKIVVAGYTAFRTPTVGGVVALDATTGALLWAVTMPNPGGGVSAGGHTALWKGRVLAAAGDGQIHALRAADGSVEFSLPNAGPLPTGLGGATLQQDRRNLTVQGDILVSGSRNTYVIGYDLTTRSVLWRENFEPASVNGQRLVSDDRQAYVIIDGLSMYVVDLQTGAVNWKAGHANNSPHGVVALWNDRVFVQADSGFYALRRQ